MKKKTLLIAAIISVLLLLGVTGTEVANLARANPFIQKPGGNVPPDDNTEPPKIIMFSPENNASYATSSIPLALNVSVGNSSTAVYCFIQKIYYQADWQPNTISVYEYDPGTLYPSYPKKTEISVTLNLTGLQSDPRFPPEKIPEGEHSVTVYVNEMGEYVSYSNSSLEVFYYFFHINSSSTVHFTIDNTRPTISVLSLENRTYDVSDIPLNFTVNETCSQITYSLDGQENVTISGNNTLTNLPNGEHYVTVYATDETGNTGTSKTIYFNVEVPEPFPTTLVTVASATTSGIITAGLLVYLRKRKEGKD